MGLIRILGDVVGGASGALSSTLNSTMWREYFESGDMSDGILMKRGQRVTGPNSKNTRADDNIITNGSYIDVQPGQVMIIVDNGFVVECCDEPGRFQYDTSSAPSMFYGAKEVMNKDGEMVKSNRGFKAVANEFLKQWSVGGQRTSTQRVYFINTGEIITKPIKWGCGDIAFHHTQVYRATGSMLEMDMILKANGEATVRISDPEKFFEVIGAQKVGGDNDGVIRITDDGIYSNLRSGIVDHVSAAISTLGTEQAVAYTAIKSKNNDIKKYLNTMLEEEWVGKRGFGIANFTINGSPIPDSDSRKQLEEMQQSFNMSQNINAMNYDIQKGYSDAARLTGQGMKAAGENGNFGQASIFGGMAMGSMGGYAAGMGNIQAQPLPNQMNQYQQPMQQMQQPVQQAVSQPAPAPVVETWVCACGAVNKGMFCTNCGSKKPEAGVQQKNIATWTCSCGKENDINSRFCPNCGNKKPIVKKYKCDKCGWEPAPNVGATTRFCPNCGDPFNDADVIEE